MIRAVRPADCADEAIQHAGAIQPQGWLLSIDPSDGTIRHASANVNDLFERSAAEMIGTPLSDHVDATVLDAIADAMPGLEAGLAAQRALSANIGPIGRICDVSLHLQQGLAHIEIEPHLQAPRGVAPEITAQGMIGRIAAIEDTDEFFARIAREVRDLTGYDRVMVYRFRPDDAGEVIAEARADDVESYLGLRYPASDIPAQARRLYLFNRLRVIPDAGYVPVPIVPAPAGEPLDLSQHVLRSVSPVHLEYLRNMGVGASMSISIISGGRLWGLIACHHRSPRHVPAMTRAVADLFGMYVSMRVAARRQESALARVERTESAIERLRARLGAGATLHDGLRDILSTATALLHADGAWMTLGGASHAIGATPPSPLLPVVRDRAAPAQAVVATANADWIPAGAPAGGVAGVLSLPLGDRGDGVHFFRREQVEDVRWAGDPDKAMVPTDDGVRLAPRRSFREWRETVRGSSLAWSDEDRRVADRLYAAFVDAWERDARSTRLATTRDTPTRAIHDQRLRLERLGALLDGVERIDAAQSRLLARRIASLEVQLRGLLGVDPATP